MFKTDRQRGFLVLHAHILGSQPHGFDRLVQGDGMYLIDNLLVNL